MIVGQFLKLCPNLLKGMKKWPKLDLVFLFLDLLEPISKIPAISKPLKRRDC